MTTTHLASLEMVTGGVTTPRGFRASGVHAGIKARGLDLALLVTERPAVAAAVFTTNRAQAAPVLVSREHLATSGGVVQAVVANSGCANACTAAAGVEVARGMASAVGQAIGCPPEQVLVASTGVIGVALSLDTVRAALPEAVAALAEDRGSEAARAIMTTDPFPKEAAARVSIHRGSFAIGGMAKGSGMIEPKMATMLAFITTDAAVPAPLLDRALRDAVDDTFNAITVDGECSTNDCVMLLANGASGVEVGADESYDAFVHALREVCLRLALGIVRGGEGATKLVTVQVTGAASSAEARRAAKAIANSPLVKTAIHGGDPNWGRLIAVAGRADVAFVLDRAAVRIGPIVLFQDGRPHDDAAPEAAAYLKNDEISVAVDLGAGTESSTVWTCDLTAEYVRINAEYRT
jgi:glutamate N-acetyltransferase/amino-acid N-acetyltransferase